MSNRLLEVEGLTVAFPSAPKRGWSAVVRDLSFEVARGEVLGLVGESGSGKTMTAYAVLGILPPQARRLAGSIRLDGEEISGLPRSALQRIRGGRIAMVFQEPAAALNPAQTIGTQIREAVRLHQAVDRGSAQRKVIELLDAVAMPDASRRARLYPHELSGGQCQRAVLAMALAGEPELLIADEPTTALDVTVQAQILRLLLELRRQLGLAILLISHDLGVIAEVCDRVVVLYAGELAEKAPASDLFERPAHPYTRALLAATPRLGTGGQLRRLQSIPGRVPDSSASRSGCLFAPRCDSAFARCHLEAPPEYAVSGGHSARCFLHIAEGEVGP